MHDGDGRVNEWGAKLGATAPSHESVLEDIRLCEQAPDFSSMSILPKGAAILSGKSTKALAMGGKLKALQHALFIEQIIIIDAIFNRSSGESPHNDFGEGYFGKDDFIWISRGWAQDELRTRRVRIDRELRHFASFDLSRCKVFFFVASTAQSIKHLGKLLCSMSSRRRTSVSRTSGAMPAFTSQLQRQSLVEPRANQFGRSLLCAR
jgi:hypothetical protein